MINVSNLTKHYGGKRALGPVSFEIADGETVGFLGLNGAGKTTALRILACDLRPSSGRIVVGGVDAVADPHRVRARIGFLPEHPPLYQDMVVRDYLRFAAALRGLRGAAFTKRLPAVLDLTDLGDVEGEIIGTLSHGYRQRVGLAQAIVHEPEFLILDEPTRGLDPVQIVEMRRLLASLKEHHTVLISSHILTEISQTCDRLLVLGNGNLLGSGTEADLTASGTDEERWQVTIAVAAGDAGLCDVIKQALASLDGVRDVTASGETADALGFEIAADRDVRAAVARAVIQGGHGLLRLDHTRTQLESAFIRMVTGDRGGSDAGN